LVCSEVIGMCLGIAAGLWLQSRCGAATGAAEKMIFWSACGMAVWGVGALGAFPLGIGAALKLNAYVWSPALMLVARGAIAGVTVLPIGIVTVLCATGQPGASRARLEVGIWLASALLGFTAASAWAFNQFAPELIVVGLAWLTLAVAGLAALASHREV